MVQRFGFLEAGGTKFVLAVGTDELEIIDRKQIPTTTPEETLTACVAYFQAHPVAALGVGSFGPLDMSPASPTYGQILATPKAGWANTDVVGFLHQALKVPIFSPPT